MSLEGITFSQDGSGASPITVNTANYGAAPDAYPPSAVIDASGVVHLLGEVRQTSATGPDEYLVGTVPGDARPSRYVYELVATFYGTYADVVITPAGQIYVIDARSPLNTAAALVSLEGISYQP